MAEIDTISAEAQVHAFFEMKLSHTDHFTDPGPASAFSSRREREEAFSGLQKRIDSIEELLDSVARVIRTYQGEVARLKTEQNKLVPIARLPDETLEEIFMELTRDSSSEKNELNTISPHLSLFATTRVCSRWRSIALGCYQLWTKPYFGPKLHFAKAMVERAHTHPLNIVWNAELDASQRFENWDRFSKTMRDNLVVELLPRARTLTIELLIHGNWLYDTIVEAPLLQEIQVNFGPEYYGPRDSNDAFDLLQRLLGQRNRALKSAHLRNRNLFTLRDPTSLSIIASLQCLEMEMAGYRHFSRERFDPVVNTETAIVCLRQLPNLRRLDLRNVFASDMIKNVPFHATSSDDKYSVSLHALRELDLIDQPLNCVRFLERVECPRLAKLVIKLVQTTGVKDVLASIPLHIRELEAGAGYSFELSPRLSSTDWTRAPGVLAEQAMASISLNVLSSTHEYSPLSLTISFLLALDQPFFHQSISAVSTISTLKKLVVNSPGFTDLASNGSLWNDLGSLPEIQTLLITDTHLSFLPLLRNKALSNKDPSSCFPSLRQLSFSNCDFTMPDDPQASDRGLRDMPDAHAKDLLSELLLYIQGRNAIRLNLQCLEFIRCKGLTTDELRRFEGVCRVTWDGEEV